MRRLAIRPGALGDFIVSLPALEHLRTDYFEVWTASPHTPLVCFADRTRSIASTGLDWIGVDSPPERLVAELREFDSIVSWYGANRPEFREAVAELGLPFEFFPAVPLPGAGADTSPRAATARERSCHAIDFYLDQVRAEPGAVPHIHCAVSRENFAVIHPYSGSPRKNWPIEKYRGLASQLQKIMPVRWCAGPEDPPLEGAVHINDLYELACWLARARLYIGNDSCVTHLAAAVGTPVLALFGPTDPEVWAPRGSNVRVAKW